MAANTDVTLLELQRAGGHIQMPDAIDRFRHLLQHLGFAGFEPLDPMSQCQGIDKEIAKKVVKLIKDKKMKVQTAIQGEQVRVTGKKRDDLQTVMAMLKEARLGLPLQYTNFRD